MSLHRFERRGRERCGGEIGEPITARRVRGQPLGDRERTGDAEPDTFLAEVGIVAIVLQPAREPAHEHAVDDDRVHVSVPG